MKNEKVSRLYKQLEETDVLDLGGLTEEDLKGGQRKPAEVKNDGGGTGAGTKSAEELEAEKQAGIKAAADLETAKKFGGAKLDDKGNVLDATGKVIKTAEEIKAGDSGSGNPPEAVEIDNVKYKLDKDGNALGEDGKIFKTKAELDALQAEEEEVPLVVELIQKSGYTIKDEKGNPKEYEDSPEGLIQWAKDVGEHLSIERDKKLFAQFPDVKDYTEYRLRGGNPSEYFKKQSTSWLNVKLDSSDEGMLTKAVVDNLMKTGMSQKEAETTATMYKDTGKLKEFGESAYKALTKAEKDAKDSEEQTYLAEVKRQEEENTQYWNTANEVIKKGRLHSISIPEADKEGFFKSLSVAVDENGNSEIAYKRDGLSLEQRLELDYLVYKGLNLSTLIALAATKQKNEGLRKRFTIKQKGAGGGNGNGHEAVNRNPNSVEINLDSIT